MLPTFMVWLRAAALALSIASIPLIMSKHKNRARAGHWLVAFAFGALWSTALIDYFLAGCIIDLATALVITATVAFGVVARLRGMEG